MPHQAALPRRAPHRCRPLTEHQPCSPAHSRVKGWEERKETSGRALPLPACRCHSTLGAGPLAVQRCPAPRARSAAAPGEGTSPSASLGNVSCAICCLTSSCLDSLCSPSAGAHERFGRRDVLRGCFPLRAVGGNGRKLTLGFSLVRWQRGRALSAAPSPEAAEPQCKVTGSVMDGSAWSGCHYSSLQQGGSQLDACGSPSLGLLHNQRSGPEEPGDMGAHVGAQAGHK